MEQLADLILPLVVIVLMIVAVPVTVVMPIYLKARDRRRLYDLLKHAYDSGQPVSPHLVQELVGDKLSTRRSDILRGTVLLAIAVAVLIVSYLAYQLVLQLGLTEPLDPAEARATALAMGYGVAALAPLPGVVGLVLLVAGLVKARPTSS